jgi:transcriptional regulator with XRE-family HTH domain
MTSGTQPAVARLGERLCEARLNARLTVREAAEWVGLRAHGTLVQYENGRVLPLDEHRRRLIVLLQQQARLGAMRQRT